VQIPRLAALAQDDGDERSERIRALERGDKVARSAYLADVITLEPTTLEGHGVRLEPMTPAHEPDIANAAADGKLWELWYTAVPAPHETAAYITTALEGQRAGHMLPWVVRELATGDVVGSTRYHDIVPAVDRVEIGYTFYAARCQRSHVNTACKLLLLGHAFETVGCGVVGLRTDNFNFRSQRAIEGIGGKRDGVIRHHYRRRDGSVRDTVMYSILATEWPDVKKYLTTRVARLAR
jgi:RimJ/RimL family protein N-acetyltransferase